MRHAVLSLYIGMLLSVLLSRMLPDGFGAEQEAAIRDDGLSGFESVQHANSTGCLFADLHCPLEKASRLSLHGNKDDGRGTDGLDRLLWYHGHRATGGTCEKYIHIHAEPECEPRIVYRHAHFGCSRLRIDLGIDVADNATVLTTSVCRRGDDRRGSDMNRAEIVLQQVRFNPNSGEIGDGEQILGGRHDLPEIHVARRHDTIERGGNGDVRAGF